MGQFKHHECDPQREKPVASTAPKSPIKAEKETPVGIDIAPIDVKPLGDILARRCLECDDCQKAKRIVITKHIRDVHKIKFKTCKQCKLIFKMGQFKHHSCNPEREKPTTSTPKKIALPKKSESLETTPASSELPVKSETEPVAKSSQKMRKNTDSRFYKPEHIELLTQVYDKSGKYPSKEEMSELAKIIGVLPIKILWWFTHRRRMEKKKEGGDLTENKSSSPDKKSSIISNSISGSGDADFRPKKIEIIHLYDRLHLQLHR
jgi:hypothetical protein